MVLESTIQEIKGRADILDVVSEFVKLKRNGANHVGLCPFHNEKSGSFTVSQGKQIYKCFGCGKSGDSVQFLMEHQKMRFIESIEWLAKKYNIEMQESSVRTYDKPVPRLQKVGDKVLQFFESRGVTNNTLLRFGITEAKEFMPKINAETAVICFNYYRGGELVNIKYRGAGKCFKMEKNAELIFYNLDTLEGQSECVIVEGEIDCLSMYEAGIHNSISVPNGAAKGNQRLEYLDNCWEYFELMKKVVIAVDNDEPGRMLKEELARRIGKDKCYFVEYPSECKDANDVLLKHGKEVLAAMVSSAKAFPVEGIVEMSDITPTVLDWYDNGYPKGAACKVDGFDDLLTFIPKQLTVVTGIPGHGKDEFMNEMMIGLSMFEGWKWGLSLFEEEPAVTVTKLAEKITRKAFAFRHNPNSRMNSREFEHARNFIGENFHFIDVSKTDTSIEGTIAKGEELVKRFGINGFVMNPWNCYEHNIPSNMNETNYVSYALSKIVNFAVRCNVHCFVVAHTTKITKDRQTGKYEVPNLYSISGSAHFFNKTHNGITVYRNYDTNITEVYVQKVKFYWLGQRGWVAYNFDTETRQYSFSSTSVQQQDKRQQWTPLPKDFTEPQQQEMYNNYMDENPF